MKSVVFWVIVGVVVALVSAEVIENTPCDVGRDATIKSTSHEITVDPCPEAANGSPCVLYRGSNATVTIRFTPTEQPVGKLRSTIAWVRGRNDLTFRAMKADACNYLNCPISAAQEQTFNATLALGGTLPTNTYPLKVKIQEVKGQKRVFACQLFKIKLSDPSDDEE